MKNNIKKHNSLTDAKTGKLSLRSDKLINALYLLYEKDGKNIKITMSELKNLLNLKGGNYGEDIESRLQELRDNSIKFRNVKLSHGNYEYFVDSFIQYFGVEKEGLNTCKIKISKSFIEAFKQKMGYTPINIETCNKFKSKYGLKLYEMYLRYYSLPNNEGEGTGKITKTIDELNEMFGTRYKHASKFLNVKDNAKTLTPIDRGLKEIENITGNQINCFYHKGEKKFIFGWEQKKSYPNLRIPYKRIGELIDWYIEHKENLKIQSPIKYRSKLKTLIIEDKFDELDSYYRGMLKYKYKLNPSEYFNNGTGCYRDFKNSAVS